MTRTMLMLTAAGVLAVSHASADLSIRWSTIDGGGFTSTGGTFTISATIGQHDAAPDRAAGGYDTAPGFWPGPELDACLADCDGSGSLNIDDIDCFVTAFLANDLGTADCDASGTLNIDDIDCFVTAFLAGCL